MNFDWPLLLFFMSFPVALGALLWLLLWPVRIARQRNVSFVPLYYVAALTIGTPLIGWIVAMVYATTATPVTACADHS